MIEITISLNDDMLTALTKSVAGSGPLHAEIIRAISTCKFIQRTCDVKQRNFEIVKLYKNGNTQKEIASMYGLSNNRISQIIKSKGLTYKSRGINSAPNS